MKIVLNIAAIVIGVICGIAVLGYASIMYFSSGAWSAARDFIMFSSTGTHEQAGAFLHRSLQTENTFKKSSRSLQVSRRKRAFRFPWGICRGAQPLWQEPPRQQVAVHQNLRSR
jgi:hypothetical protein